MGEVRRVRFGPGLWPGPRRQARWAGRGSRVKGARRDATEGSALDAGGASPDNARRTGPGAVHLFRDRRTWRDVDGLVVVLAGAAAGYGGNRMRPVTGGAVRGSRRVRRACVRRTRRNCRPATARPRGEPRPPTAGHPGRSSLSTARARPRCSRPGPSGPARRRCALESPWRKL
jgi:hypothetical protein